jgi:putative intracellular protease/amidase
MSRTILDISMSRDGFIAGPNRSLDRPLGEGGLDRWARQVASFREAHAHAGAAVFDRRMFSGGEGTWQDDPNLQALLTYVRAAGEHSAEPVTAICGRVAGRHGVQLAEPT